MKYSNSFYYDLDFAESAQKWVNDLFTGGLKVEVKSDRMASKTGNIFIEVYSRGKESGISTTEAAYWIYRIDDKDLAIIISTKRLKELVKYFYGKNGFKNGGDNDTSKGVLIPLNSML